MLNTIKSFFNGNERQIAQARKIVDQINALEPEVEKMSDEQIQARVNEFKAELKKLVDKIPVAERQSIRRIQREKGLPAAEVEIQSKLQQILPEVYAFVREAYKREMGIRHYDVQLLAGVILAQGQKLVEVKTGEGKTMSFNLPTFLYALVGRGAHLVTVNEYLAKRDGEYAGHVASKLGLTVGIVAPNGVSFKFISNEQVKELKGEETYKELLALGKPKLSTMRGHNLVECDKREAYNCDITVSVNSELGFDYLRDNMAWEVGRIVQRELYFCMVDEADSILIDEARTPLIISATPTQSDVDKYTKFAKVVKGLEEGKDYEIDHKSRQVSFTEDGIQAVEKMLGLDNLWTDYNAVHHLDNALRAKALYKKDDEYIVKNDEVLIVDSFTGRVMPGRRFSEGLHQAIEAKEGVKVQEEAKTFATITFQNYFRLYKVLTGGSGTIITEGEEFFKIYGLESVAIPTHRPISRDDKNDLIYRNQEVKFRALANEVKELHEKGQPVLIGTTSVEKSELVSQMLDQLGVPHEVLNAKYHEQEAQIVAKAGEKGAVTVATNMAGRGTDIPLGEGVRELGGLAVIGSERHEARRIDNQLRGRSGRQGDPGYSRFYVSLDDTIMRVLGGDLIAKSVGRMLDDDMPIQMSLITRQIEVAQKRVESLNFDMRKNVVDYDDVMNQQREVFYARRRRLLTLSENAQGRFGYEAEGEADKAAEMVEEAKMELQDMVVEILNEQLDKTIQVHAGSSRKMSDEDVEALLPQVLDFAPDKDLAVGLSVKEKELNSHLKNLFITNDAEGIREKLSAGLMQVLHAKLAEFGADMPMVVKMLMLETMDVQWMEHLETMSDVNHGIRLQSIAQRDPLVEYKNIGFRLFGELIERINSNIARRILKVQRVQNANIQVNQSLNTNQQQIVDINTGDREMLPTDTAELKSGRRLPKPINQAKKTEKNTEPLIGRNDPCPCGSGLKYKKCGLINAPEHQKHSKK
ncbi:MAG: SEC-C domain-containing protein [Candidatus Doudnabacteria bacterium]|nr:SEC-C domain-containing protein [Candidatus Doudnabacteria bacterium]